MGSLDVSVGQTQNIFSAVDSDWESAEAARTSLVQALETLSQEARDGQLVQAVSSLRSEAFVDPESNEHFGERRSRRSQPCRPRR